MGGTLDLKRIGKNYSSYVFKHILKKLEKILPVGRRGGGGMSPLPPIIHPCKGPKNSLRKTQKSAKEAKKIGRIKAKR